MIFRFVTNTYYHKSQLFYFLDKLLIDRFIVSLLPASPTIEFGQLTYLKI